MKCVSYTRAMTTLDKGEIASDIISVQNELIQNYADKNKIRISKKYSDRKKSVDAEEAYRQMVADGLKREFDLVVITSVYRCGKTLWDAEETLRKVFFPAGINFAVVEDDFCSIGKTIKEVDDFFLAKRNEEKGKGLTSYLYDMLENKILTHVFIKYGYVLSEDHKSLLIDKDVEHVIKEIYELRLTGLSFVAIAKELDKRGYMPPIPYKMKKLGRYEEKYDRVKWSGSTVNAILHSKSYIGEPDGGDTFADYYIDPIISREVFEKVREMDSEPRPNGQYTPVNVFHQKIVSKQTGKAMLCCKVTKDGSKRGFTRYKSNYSKIYSGSNPYIPYEDVERMVKDEIIKEVHKAKNVYEKLFGDDYLQAKKRTLQPYVIRANELVDVLAQIADERIALYREYADAKISEDEYTSKKDEIFKRVKSLDDEYQSLLNQAEIIEKAYGKTNPWIQAFNIDEADIVFTRKNVNKWLEQIIVDNLKTVEIIPTHKNYRELLPKEWMGD